jgi:nucleoside-diphosphate-sugar epimerase
MRVLVTGATGFIGRHLVPLLLERGDIVVAVARDEAKARRLEWFDDVEFHAMDLHESTGDVAKELGNPDSVVHLAWHGLPNYTEMYHIEQNLLMDYWFLKAMVQGGTRRILVTGTCFEYGIVEGCLTEDMCPQPANPYAVAKDSLRRFLQELQRHESFTLQWARLFYMYGAGQAGGSILAQLEEAIEKGATVFEMTDGEQLRDYLPVEEVARRLALLNATPSVEGMVNVCSESPVSIRQLVGDHAKRLGSGIRLGLGLKPRRDYEPTAFWGASRVFDRNGELI